MKTEFTINVRCFPVIIRDERTGQKLEDAIVFDKDRLRAAEAAGIGARELIQRTYNRQGYRVLEIGEAQKRVISMDLLELYKLHSRALIGERKRVDG